MKITKLQGLTVLSMLVVSTFSSCEEHNPFSEQELFNQEYSKNFFKTYGQFPAGQNWDFSERPRTCATDPSVFDLGSEIGGGTLTRAHSPEGTAATEEETAAIYTKKDGYYYVEKETVEWLQKNVPEEANNTTAGSPFTMIYDGTATTKKFALMPIYKGRGSVKYKLHLVSVKAEGNKDYIIWDNWQLTETNPATEINPEVGTDDFQYNWKDDYPADASSTNWINVLLKHDLGTLQKKNIRSKPIIISGLTGEFYFYLEFTCGPTYGDVGEHESSKEGMMIALNCPTPTNIKNGTYNSLLGVESGQTISQTMIIGCEDSKKSDWDMNDIVFLMVGLTDLPQKREAKHSKRYLIEDLGTTVDFDFNDVVVDVTETLITDPETGEETVYTQEAIIKHLCGTVPFKVYFVGEDGEYSYTKAFNFGNEIQGEVQGLNEECKDENGNYTYKLIYSQRNDNIVGATGEPFWDPARNNIRIDVGSSETLHGESWSDAAQIKTGHFNKPDEATAPYIIAVPTTVMWTSERDNFPIKNFVELPVTEKGDEHPKGN